MKDLQYFNTNEIDKKLDFIIKLSWELLQKKIQNNLIKINKEASLQLQFAYILQELITVSRYSEDEHIKVILEDTVLIQNGKPQEVDVIVETTKDNLPYRVAIEMKCYRTKTSTGGNRGAIDIFVKDVYEDLEVLENYKLTNKDIKKTYFLAMTDYKNIIIPENKDAKYWAYDISDNHQLKGPISLNIPIGGKEVDIKIKDTYDFQWTNIKNDINNFYFLLLEN